MHAEFTTSPRQGSHGGIGEGWRSPVGVPEDRVGGTFQSSRSSAA